MLPQKGCRTQKKKKKPLWRSLLRTTIWQQPINPHAPFFHKTSFAEKRKNKKGPQRDSIKATPVWNWRKGIIHNVQPGLVAYLYHQFEYSQSSRLLSRDECKMCVCVCVCVWEREREKGGRERGRRGKREEDIHTQASAWNPELSHERSATSKLAWTCCRLAGLHWAQAVLTRNKTAKLNK